MTCIPICIHIWLFFCLFVFANDYSTFYVAYLFFYAYHPFVTHKYGINECSYSHFATPSFCLYLLLISWLPYASNHFPIAITAVVDK